MQELHGGYHGTCQYSMLPTLPEHPTTGWPALGNDREVEDKGPGGIPGAIACLVNTTTLPINVFITLSVNSSIVSVIGRFLGKIKM